jgi:formate dehydrogenase major subunit
VSSIDETAAVTAKPFQTLARQLEKLPPCQAQCPNSGDVRGWLGLIAQHEKIGLSLDESYDEAWRLLAERNPLAATIGRICPHPCESLCTRSDKDGAVSINAMERFLGDWSLSRKLDLPQARSEACTESIGVIGSGPASLSFAYQMVRRGYPVTMYEQRSRPGGMLRYAIPDYRLPREVLDAEVQRILDLGITLVSDSDVGDSINLDGKKVFVIGGGNTAIDAARSARRDGADVTLLYRRGEEEMPAIASEVEDARREGVEFRFLAAPTRIDRNEGEICSIEVQAMRLGKPDDSGRRRPEPVPGQLQDFAADIVIVAVAQAPDWAGVEDVAESGNWLRTAADGKLDVNLWAGGDDRGPGIASSAIAQGRLAAESAHAELRGDSPPARDMRRPLASGMVKTDYYRNQPRTELARRPADECLADPDAEIETTLTSEQAREEAARCMSCGLCMDCEQCFMYCNQSGFTRIEETRPGHYFAMALDACEGCGKCIEICPCGYLEPRAEAHDHSRD